MAAPTITQFRQNADFATNFTASLGTLSIQKVSLPTDVSATKLVALLNFIGSSNASGAITMSHAVYTISSGTASLASSATRALSWTSGSATTATSVFGGISGTRYMTASVSYAMTPGDYLFGWLFSSAGTATIGVFGDAGPTIVGTLDGAETTDYLDGVSATGAFPASIAVTDTNYVRTGVPALRQPGIILIGTGG
jgi:hypothetical protein